MVTCEPHSRRVSVSFTQRHLEIPREPPVGPGDAARGKGLGKRALAPTQPQACRARPLPLGGAFPLGGALSRDSAKGPFAVPGFPSNYLLIMTLLHPGWPWAFAALWEHVTPFGGGEPNGGLTGTFALKARTGRALALPLGHPSPAEAALGPVVLAGEG